MENWLYGDKRIESIEDFPEGTFGFIYITNRRKKKCAALD